jgi:predicted negative regulator of RcsB-dependent stress response
MPIRRKWCWRGWPSTRGSRQCRRAADRGHERFEGLELRHIARLRLARVLIDQGKPDEALKTLAKAPPGGVRVRYHEVRGDAFYAKKDVKSALSEYQAALAAAASRRRR